MTQVTNNGKTIAAGISTDGKYLLSVVDENGKQSIWLRHVLTGSDAQVIAPSDDFYDTPAFSPDESFIYFRKAVDKVHTGFNLLRAPVLGGAPQLVVRDVDTAINFSPDGKRMAYARGESPEPERFQVLTASADGTDEKILATGSLSVLPTAVAWSPDGKQIATAIPGTGDVLSAIQVQDVASGKSQALARFNNLQMTDLAWLPDGRGLFATYQKNVTLAARSQVGFVSNPGGQFRSITKDTNNYRTLSLSADGKILATVQQKARQTLYLLPPMGFAGKPPEPARGQNKDSFFFHWTSNGDIYFGDGGNLLRISTDGSNKATLLSDPASQVLGATGCTGGRYAVVVWAGHLSSNKVNIWRVDPDGSNPKQLTDGMVDIIPICSPDGEWAYYQDLHDFRTKRVPIEGGTPEIVPGTVVPGALPDAGLDISRNGKLLAFPAGKSEKGVLKHIVVLVNLDGQPATQRRVLDADARTTQNALRLTPDGKAVIYPIRENGVDNLWLQPLDGAQGRQITNFSSDAINMLEFSPDGKTLGVLRSHLESDVVLLRDTGSPVK